MIIKDNCQFLNKVIMNIMIVFRERNSLSEADKPAFPSDRGSPILHSEEKSSTLIPV